MMKQAVAVPKALIVGGLVAGLSMTAYAQYGKSRRSGQSDGPGVSVAVRGSVQETIERLGKMVADNGMMVMGELHQGKVLAMTGLKVESETIFVGNPNVGKQLFSEERGAGVAVPVRINVYSNESGQTVVRYIPPSKQLEAFSNDNVDKVCGMLDQKLENMLSMLPK